MRTLVQHSGYGYGGNPQFRSAVETREVKGKRAQNAVLKAGGVLFETYQGAEDAAEKENYPPEVNGLVPIVRGSFSSHLVDGLAIYVPKDEGRIRVERVLGSLESLYDDYLAQIPQWEEAKDRIQEIGAEIMAITGLDKYPSEVSK